MNAKVALGPSSEMGVIWRYGGTIICSVHLLKSLVASQASDFLFVFVGLQCAESS